MFNKSNIFSKIQTITMLGAFLGTSISGLSLYLNNSHVLLASEFQFQDLSNSISNLSLSLASGSSDDAIRTPSNWMVVNPNNVSAENIKAGIIDTSETLGDDHSDLGLDNTTFPGTPTLQAGSYEGKEQSLMINAESSGKVYGYQSGTFPLNTQSYYEIRVTAAATDAATGTILLDGFNNGRTYKMSVDSSWREYSFFIKTGVFTPESVSLKLFLGTMIDANNGEGSSGAVFFNRVQFFEYNESNFYTQKSATTSDNTPIDLSSGSVTTLYDFEQGDAALSGFELTDVGGDGTNDRIFGVKEIGEGFENALYTPLGIENPNSYGAANNHHALLMYQKDEGTMSFATSKSSVVLERGKIYRVSFWAYGKTTNSPVCTIGNDQNDRTATINIDTTPSTFTSNNGWKEYVFYTTTSTTTDSRITMKFDFGTEETGNSGFLWLDMFRIQEVTSEEKSSANGSNETKTDYSISSDSTSSVTNGKFDDYTIHDGVNVPNSWTAFEDNDGDSSKIMVLDTTNWTESLFNPDQNSAAKHGNILVLQNKLPGITTGIRSADFTVSANTFVCVSFDVNSALLDSATNLSVTVENDTTKLFSKSNMNTDGQWRNIKIYIKSGSSDQTVHFNLSISSETASGYAYFDNFKMVTFTAPESDSSGTTAEDILELDYKANIGKDSYKYDFRTVNFGNTVNSNTTNELYTPLDWTATVGENGQAKYGIKDNSLYLSSTSMGDVQVDYQYNYPFTLGANNYYRVAVTLMTRSISVDERNAQYDADGHIILPGASIKLSGYTDGYRGINTALYPDEYVNTNGTIKFGTPASEQYVTYYFFIATGDTTTNSNITISLGDEMTKASGEVWVKSVEFFNFETEEAFNEGKDSVDLLHQILLGDTDEEDEEDTDTSTDTSTETSGFDMNWLILPTVLLALAMLVAVAGTIFRRFHVKKHVKVKTKYDRRKTIESEMNKQEMIDYRRSIITELEAEMTEIDDEIASIRAQFAPIEEKTEAEHKKLIEAFRVEKSEIQAEHERAVKEYKQSIATMSDPNDRARSEREFARYIHKLQEREERVNIKLNEKNKRLERIQARKEEQLAKYLARQKQIQEEIARVEAEIEEIARQDAKIWADYKQAKLEAKKKRAEYREQMKQYRASKRNKSNSDTDTASEKSANKESKKAAKEKSTSKKDAKKDTAKDKAKTKNSKKSAKDKQLSKAQNEKTEVPAQNTNTEVNNENAEVKNEAKEQNANTEVNESTTPSTSDDKKKE